ncbi:MAG: translation initiation factor IF-2 subunit gamma [Candidatus Nanoclepta minutus]|uniref:protein-synthesizing GTPase n=1 Tax=Candidatus Nanoclepta minutus TaxID=1940235 RepID=A0A397WNX7_9ARCH|nr:MAG: translation initiation factor IF-2 subunit gamma [Candidatus Nanoclepta minutus]
MSNKVYPDLSIVILGHVDHGKTTLAKAFTGRWIAKHSEELKRGLTIKLGYANFSIYKCQEHGYTTKDRCPICGKETDFIRKISLLDVPGHEALLSVMLSGAAIVDAGILVIAANEPVPQPQTLEHLLIFKLLGDKPLLVVQNKIDLLKKEEAIENYKKIQDLLKSVGIKKNIPIIPISAINEINIEYILEWLATIPSPKRNIEEKPIFLASRSFDVNKPGSEIEDLKGGVLGGSVMQGKFKVGDEIEIKPGLFINNKWVTIKTKIKNLMQGDERVEEIIPGGTSSIETYLDPFLTKDDTLSGQIVGLVGDLPDPVDRLTIEYEQIKKDRNLKEGEEILVTVYNIVSRGIILKKSGNEILVKLSKPLIAKTGNKSVILAKTGSRWSLFGVGEVK